MHVLQLEVEPSSTAGQHFRWLIDPHGELPGQTRIVAVQGEFFGKSRSETTRTAFCCAMVAALQERGTSPPAAMTSFFAAEVDQRLLVVKIPKGATCLADIKAEHVLAVACRSDQAGSRTAKCAWWLARLAWPWIDKSGGAKRGVFTRCLGLRYAQWEDAVDVFKAYIADVKR